MRANEKAQDVGFLERCARVVGGCLLAFIGLAYLLGGPLSLPMVALGVALAALGGDFVYTGVTGYCPLYNKLGFGTALSREPWRLVLLARYERRNSCRRALTS